MVKIIKNVTSITDTVPYKSLVNIQKDLKDLTDKNFNKLKKEIINEGFASPVYVWVNDSVPHVLDGVQRLRVITHLIEKEGYSPFDVPIVRILDDSFEKAKKRLLSYVSVYGTLSSDGLREFMFDARLEMLELEERFSLPQNNFDLDKFKTEYFVEPEQTDFSPLAPDDKIKEHKVCPHCGEEL